MIVNGHVTSKYEAITTNVNNKKLSIIRQYHRPRAKLCQTLHTKRLCNVRCGNKEKTRLTVMKPRRTENAMSLFNYKSLGHVD